MDEKPKAKKRAKKEVIKELNYVQKSRAKAKLNREQRKQI